MRIAEGPASILKPSRGRQEPDPDYNLDGGAVQSTHESRYRTDGFLPSSARESRLADREGPIKSCATCASVSRQLDVFNSSFADYYEDRHHDLLDEVERRNGELRAKNESLQSSLANLARSVFKCRDRDADLLARIESLEKSNEAALGCSRKLEGKIRFLESYSRDLMDELSFLSDNMPSTSHLNIDYSGPNVPKMVSCLARSV